MKKALLPFLPFCLFPLAPNVVAQNRIVISPDAAKAKEVAIDELMETGKIWEYTDATLESAWKEKGFKWSSAASSAGTTCSAN